VNDQEHKELMVRVLALVHRLKSLASTREPMCSVFSLTDCSTAIRAASEPLAQLHSGQEARQIGRGAAEAGSVWSAGSLT